MPKRVCKCAHFRLHIKPRVAVSHPANNKIQSLCNAGGFEKPIYKRGRVLLTEILMPRIARQGTHCLNLDKRTSSKSSNREVELDEGFQPYHPPSEKLRWAGMAMIIITMIMIMVIIVIV